MSSSEARPAPDNSSEGVILVDPPIRAQLGTPIVSMRPAGGEGPTAMRVGLLNGRVRSRRSKGQGDRLRAAGSPAQEFSGMRIRVAGLPRHSVRDSLSSLEMNKPSPPAHSGPSSRASERPPRVVYRPSAVPSASRHPTGGVRFISLSAPSTEGFPAARGHGFAACGSPFELSPTVLLPHRLSSPPVVEGRAFRKDSA